MLALPAWLVVGLHVLFGLAETVGWSAMAARFGYDPYRTEITRPLALNQGAYNLGLATVLGWALATGRTQTAVAMLAYVVAMGVVGAVSVRWTIFLVQGVPAVIAIIALMLA